MGRYKVPDTVSNTVNDLIARGIPAHVFEVTSVLYQTSRTAKYHANRDCNWLRRSNSPMVVREHLLALPADRRCDCTRSAPTHLLADVVNAATRILDVEQAVAELTATCTSAKAYHLEQMLDRVAPVATDSELPGVLQERAVAAAAAGRALLAEPAVVDVANDAPRQAIRRILVDRMANVLHDLVRADAARSWERKHAPVNDRLLALYKAGYQHPVVLNDGWAAFSSAIRNDGDTGDARTAAIAAMAAAAAAATFDGPQQLDVVPVTTTIAVEPGDTFGAWAQRVWRAEAIARVADVADEWVAAFETLAAAADADTLDVVVLELPTCSQSPDRALQETFDSTIRWFAQVELPSPRNRLIIAAVPRPLEGWLGQVAKAGNWNSKLVARCDTVGTVERTRARACLDIVATLDRDGTGAGLSELVEIAVSLTEAA